MAPKVQRYITTGLVILLTVSVSEAVLLRARSASSENQTDVEWDEQHVHSEGGVGHPLAGGHPMDARAYVQDLLAGVDASGDMNPEMGGILHLLKSTPMKDLLDVVKPEVDKMETQILDAKTSAQNELDAIEAAFTTCKNNQTAGEGEAGSLQSTMNGKRQPHTNCREVESSEKIEYDACVKTMTALKTTKDLACNAYNDAVKSPNVNLVPAPNNNEEYKLWLGRVKAWVDGQLSSVTQKEAACDTARSDYENEKDRCEGPSGDGGLKKAWEDKKTQCDEAQTAFETAACDYSSKVAATCSSYGTCVAATETVYNNQRPHIESEEKDRETEYRTVQRIKCLLNVWGAQGDSVDKAKLQECVDKTHSTSHLELSYPTIPVVDACPLPERPYTPGFVSAEYGSLPAQAPKKECVPCAGAASTPASTPASGAGGLRADLSSGDTWAEVTVNGHHMVRSEGYCSAGPGKGHYDYYRIGYNDNQQMTISEEECASIGYAIHNDPNYGPEYARCVVYRQTPTLKRCDINADNGFAPPKPINGYSWTTSSTGSSQSGPVTCTKSCMSHADWWTYIFD